MHPLAIQTEHLDDDAIAWMRERCRLERCAPEDPRFPELLESAHALVVRTYTTVDDALLDGAPNLKVVGRAGVGLDNIDVGACRRRNVEVVHTPDANSQAVCELVVAFCLDAHRPRVFIEKSIGVDHWKRLREELRAERQLSEMTMGVVGMGRVGSRVARAASGLGMSVICNDLLELPPERLHGATPVPLDDLLGAADVVTLHVDDRPQNRSLIGPRELALLQPDATLINTSRGFVVDRRALAEWLRKHHGARALLDVHEPEPIERADPLLGVPNAHLTPHIGAATRAAHRAMSWVVRDVWAVLEGLAPEWPAPVRTGT